MIQQIISSHNLYRFLGMAYISGMCQSHRRCSIAEDTGLDIALTIAHELGHKYVETFLISFKAGVYAIKVSLITVGILHR